MSILCPVQEIEIISKELTGFAQHYQTEETENKEVKQNGL